MNKKILVISVLAVFVLVAVSFSTVVSSKPEEQRESPLFGIRTNRAITEKITNIVENIRTKFLGERIFFIPFIDGFYKIGTRLWTSMCTQLPTTMPGCGAFCTFKCQNNNMIPFWTDSKGNCDTTAPVFCTFYLCSK
jgi:hypothetical protein